MGELAKAALCGHAPGAPQMSAPDGMPSPRVVGAPQGDDWGMDELGG